MAVQVIRAGSSVRVIVEARGIADTEIVAGFLIITYTDGTTENAGYVGGGSGITPTIFNTLGESDLPGEVVEGFTDIADTIDARLTALGY